MVDTIHVSALNAYVRSVLESDAVLGDIAVCGEISNFVRNYKTGHCYFAIKDAKASVRAVMFRTDAERLSFLPQDGQQVTVRGRITLYERDGTFQIIVEFMFPQGLGAAQMAYEMLKNRLEAEGLFREEYKKPLPPAPQRVGVITSKTGAALQDILNITRRRCPDVTLVLAPSTMQGERTEPEVCSALQALDQPGMVDVIIIARGGGSAEDLGVFNSEKIARAVFSCHTPVVSAIGHEIDFTILDLVADMRAPTPSAAAELVLPNLKSKLQEMMYVYANIVNNMHHRLNSCYNVIKYNALHPALFSAKERIRQNNQKINDISELLVSQIQNKSEAAQTRLAAAAQLANSLSPYAVLSRGYSVTTHQGKTLKSVQAVAPDDSVRILLVDGTLQCTVNQINPTVYWEQKNEK